MSLTSFPEPAPLNKLEIGAPNVEQKMDATLMTYTLQNPHPGYGTDPNILNELGHTVYPKWVDGKNGEKAIAKDAAEEAELTGKEVASAPAKPTGNGWGA